MTHCRPLAAVLVVLMAALALQVGRTSAQPLPPDLTHGGVRDDKHDWTLGPTGARGWIWAKNFVTTDARQILITRVDPGSPSDGILVPGDVILGVDGVPFAGDARIAMGRAITEAEGTRHQGRLRLIRWRGGRSEQVVVRLAVLGDYGPRAPADCAKSRRIVDMACRRLEIGRAHV